jgi:catechol 2,3-dioxygenase-like lactoylglutathione lyase family enzyme
MKITSIHHVQITIPANMEKQAKLFYCDLLGLPEIPKPASLQNRGGFWLQVGDRQVHVGTEPDVDRTATKAHIAYHVTDLSAWRSRLEAHGIQPLDSIPIPGFDRFEFRDPFGNRVEFIEKLANNALS